MKKFLQNIILIVLCFTLLPKISYGYGQYEEIILLCEVKEKHEIGEVRAPNYMPEILKFKCDLDDDLTKGILVTSEYYDGSKGKTKFYFNWQLNLKNYRFCQKQGDYFKTDKIHLDMFDERDHERIIVETNNDGKITFIHNRINYADYNNIGMYIGLGECDTF